MKSLKYWKRFECEGLAIFVDPRKPDWFVPDHKADALLCGNDCEGERDLLAKARLFSFAERSSADEYTGRKNSLQLSLLKECWFHLTNACNLACRHCLFSASPSATHEALDPGDLERGIREARALGCTLFYFTGGEPFVYPEFPAILRGLLEDPDVHAVVLTNGLLLEKHGELFAKIPRERLHLQVSLDGLEKNHDALRGKGTFARLASGLDFLHRTGIHVTLSVAVNQSNVKELSAVTGFAADKGIRNIHFLWHFVRGKGSRDQFVPAAEIWTHLRPALETAEAAGITVDNVEALRGQVFASPGTRHDLSNSGWESIAVGPDGAIYPSPALVGIDDLRCGFLGEGLENVWRQSPVLEDVRQATLAGSAYEKNPLKFLVGGGDIDHSFISGGNFVGHDPYVELYNNIALWLIARRARRYPHREDGSILLKMGDVRSDCPDGGSDVSLTHCNCVVSLADDRGHSTVRDFYGRAAVEANDEIVNPFAAKQAEAEFIPAVSRQRSYGCGSPVHDAGLTQGEVLVDLGSGSGVECFQAAEMVGESGRVFGIDMTDAMLSLARSSQKQVAANLGYNNIEFKKGFLESIPLEDCSADAVISNCVINLSPDKRQTLHEAFRILKPGGRLVVSDIVTDEQIPVRIKNNEKLRGECLGGAMQQEDLMAMLRAAGFTAIRLVKRFPYRLVGDTSFYSLTFIAYKPGPAEEVEIIYRGPFGAVYTESGVLLLKGKKMRIAVTDFAGLDDSVFVVDGQGAVVNVSQTDGCCGLPPENSAAPAVSCCPTTTAKGRQHSDCMVCGNELRYFTRERNATCHYCGEQKDANATCLNGHFVCDGCHQDKGLAVIKKICTESAVEDMITLLKKIRSHPAISMHGPEHHAMVPGIILSAYRARGGKVGKDEIRTAIERGSRVPGGVCGFWGGCGAAIGVGIAFSVIIEATPLTPVKRQKAQQTTAKILEKIAGFQAGRCCQRETVIALTEAARLSGGVLQVSLLAADTLQCSQYPMNRECIRKTCLLWESRDKNAESGQPLALVI
ncbi:MAG: DUF5714 domain-containing protein [Pseudomonadota bacterium]